jgi:hypothetical protein
MIFAPVLLFWPLLMIACALLPVLIGLRSYRRG